MFKGWSTCAYVVYRDAALRMLQASLNGSVGHLNNKIHNLRISIVIMFRMNVSTPHKIHDDIELSCNGLMFFVDQFLITVTRE